MLCLTATPSSPVPRTLPRDKEFSKEREILVLMPSACTPCTLYRLGHPAWGFAPGKHIGAQQPLSATAELSHCCKGWEKATQLLTPTVAAVMVCAALRDPLAGDAAPPAASLQRPPGIEVSPEDAPRGGWPQHGAAVKEETVPQQLASNIVAVHGVSLRGSRQNTVCHAGH